MRKAVEKFMGSSPKTMAKFSVGCISLAVLIMFGVKGLVGTGLLALGLFLGFMAMSKFMDYFFDRLDRP